MSPVCAAAPYPPTQFGRLTGPDDCDVQGRIEPGVLAFAYLTTTRTGHSYVLTALAENPSQPIDETIAAPIVLSAIKGAFTLVARR